MIFLSRTLPVIVALCFGVLGIGIYYVPHAAAQNLERELALWLRVVFAFSYLLGLYSLLNLHWQRIRQRVEGWGYSAMVYVGFGLMMLFVIHNDGQGPFAPQAEGTAA